MRETREESSSDASRRGELGASPAESLTKLPLSETAASSLHRRLTYLMAFRVLLITLVMGATTLLYWLGDIDLSESNSVVLYVIIGITYLLTLVYALVLKRTQNLGTWAAYQLAIDLVIATIIVHVTGGAQSAYTFFYPLAVIGSAVVRYRKGAIIVSLAAGILFFAVSYLGWRGILPVPYGQRLLPTDMSALAFSRAVALNLAAIAGVSAMAIQLANQLQRSTADLAVHRSVAADLLTLHQDIIRCLTSGLATVDLNGKLLTINQAAADILGCNAARSVGEPLSTISTSLASLTKEISINEQARRGEVQHRTGEAATQTLGVSISPLVDHKGHSIGRVINFQDLTEVRQMEDQVKRAERLAVIGTLAAGVAHEIRNPLASISGSIELLGSDPSTDEDSAALMRIVTREIERLNDLITELLDYANPRAPSLTTFDLCEVVRDTLRVFAQTAKFSRVSVEFEGDDEGREIRVEADPERIRQLIWNLLRNGAEASVQGGQHLWVSVDALEAEAELVFRDDGPGIPQEVLAHIFDPFFTTKAKGSGLGLATVHSTVSDHAGTITVTSESNQGACFRVRLPYHHAHDV